MDIPLYSYDPVNQHYSVVWMALAVFVIGMIGAIWLFRQKPTPGSSIYTGLVGMLIGFIALIALGTVISGCPRSALKYGSTILLNLFCDGFPISPQSYRNLVQVDSLSQ